jgi:hypothetical protein
LVGTAAGPRSRPGPRRGFCERPRRVVIWPPDAADAAAGSGPLEDTFMDYKVADITLADYGRTEILLA